MDSTALRSALRGLRFALLFGCLIAGGPVLAGPEGGNVVAGAAEFVQSTPQRLDINQNSDKAIIDWRSFSIQVDEHTNFDQPSASSITLNRVTGDARSDILGRLTANGQVMLINPHGILFGKTARVDVAGLVATTIDIANDDFMAGRFNFNGAGEPGAVVVNRGEITVAEGGLAAFVAPGVENAGVIQARLGRVALASGNSFTLDLYGDSLVHLAVGDEVASELLNPEGKKLTALVGNSGTIRADGGTVLLAAATARQVVDHVINMDGIVEARSVHAENGEIVLLGGDESIVRVAGRLDASGRNGGERGGTVKVLGEKVGLYDGARIDASGDAGGGTVLIGGNFQGGGPERAAARTYVAADARITADALGNGDGGRVIVWAEEFTNYRGSISARGGAAGGDGGFAEVSGKDSLAFHGTADLRAPNGETGTLLLDPKNITITNGGSDTVSANDTFAENAAADASFDASQIVTALNGANLTLQANNDITVSEAIDASGGGAGNLVLQAGRSITVNQNITLNGTFTATANDTNAQAGNRDAGVAAFTMADGVTISTATADGNIVITMSTGPGGTTSGDITLEGLNAGSGHIDLSNDGATNGSGIVRASADSSIVGASAAFDISDGTNNTSGGIGTSAAPMLTTVTNLEARGQGGGVFVTESNGLTVGGATLGGLTGVSTAGSNGDITLTQTAGDLELASEAITANGSGDITLTLSGSGAALVTDNAADDIASTSGDITITADNLTLASGNITSSGALVLQPDETGRSVGVSGGNGNFNLSATELDLLSDGFSSITIGRSDGTGLMSISAGTFRDPMVFRVGGSAGRIGVGGAITSAAADASLTFTAGNILSSIGTISSGSGDITITANSIGISASITGTGALVLQPVTATRTVGIGGGAGGFNFNDTEIGNLSDGFSSITIGRSDGTGAVDIDAVTFNDNVTVRGGAMTVTGLAAGANNVTLTSSSSTIDEDADDTVADITTSGTLSLTAGGAIGASGGNGALDLSVGTLQATTSAGGIFLRESDTLSIGSSGVETTGGNAAIELTLAAGNLTLGGAITANGSGNVSLTSSGTIVDDTADTTTDITTTGTLTMSAGGAIGASGSNGALDLTVGTLQATTSAGGIFLRESDTLIIGGTGVQTTGGDADIEIALAAGDLTLNEDITANGSGDVTLTLSGANAALITDNAADDIASTSGDITITADTLTLASGNVTSSGALVLQPVTTTRTLGIGGGTGDFNLTDTEIGTLSDGFSAITIGRSDGTGAVDIDAVTFTDNVTIRGGAIAVTGLAAGSNTVTLTSTGAITDGDGGTTTDITGSTVTLTAASGIGASGTLSAVEVDATTISASSSTSGGIFLNLRNNASATALTANAQGSGNIQLFSLSQTLTLTDVAAADGEIFVQVQGALAVGVVSAAGNAVSLDASLSTITEAGTADADVDITAGTLTLRAGGAIGASGGNGALDLAVSSLAASTSAGGIFLNESDGLATGNGSFGLTGVQTTGGNADIEIALAAGDLTLNEDITANGSGDVTLTLSGSGAALVTDSIADDIASTSGDITITADRLTLANGSISSSGALVLQPNAASETIGLGNGASGDFNLDASELGLLSDGFSSITIGRTNAGAVDVNAHTFTDSVTIRGGAMTVTGLAAGANDVSLTSSSTIDEDADDNTADVTTSGTLALSAGGAIGASGGNGALDLTVGTLQATTSSGGIFLRESDTLIIGGTGVQTTGGNADIEVALTAGDLTLNEDITANGSGDITLTLSGAGVAVNTDNAADDIASTSGDITITAYTLTLASGNITSSGALVLQPNATGRSVGVSGGAGDFNLSTTEIDLLSDGFSSITIGRSDSTALMTIGADTYRDPMAFRMGGAGGDISIGGAITSAAANTSLTFTAGTGTGGTFTQGANTIASGTGDITITADVVALSTVANSITGTGAITLQPATTTTTIGIGDGATGTFDLDAAEIGALSDGFSSITIGASGGSGAMDVNAITFNDDVTIRGGAIAVTGLAAGANTVTLTSSGAITDGDGGTTTDLTGSTVTMTAASGIGATGANGSLEVDATTLSATNSTSGGIFVQSVGVGGVAVTADAQGTGDIEITGSSEAVTLSDLDATDGAISVTLTGQDIVATDVVASGSSGSNDDITLTTQTSGDITLGSVSATGDEVTISSAGAIGETGAGDAGVDVTAETLTLDAASGIGGTGELDLETTVATLDVDNTTSGAIVITESDDVTVNQLDQDGGGDVSLTSSGGTITIAAGQSGVTATGGTVTLTADTALTVNDVVTTTGGAIDLDAGTTLTLNAALTGAGGAVALDGGNGITVTASGDVTTTTGAVTFGGNAAGAITTAGDVTTAGGTVTYARATTLSGAVAVGTGTGGGDIAFTGAIDGGNALTLTAGTGDVTLSGDAGGSTALSSLTASGASIGLQDVTTSGAQSYTGSVTFNSSYQTTGSNFTVTGASTLASDATVSTGSGGGDILFDGTVDGTTADSESLTLTAGSGDITFAGNVGVTTRLDGVTINSAKDVAVQATMETTTFTQEAGSGTTDTGSSTLNTTGAITITAADITGAINGGDLTLTSENGIEVTVDVASLTINGPRATIIGTVAGLGGAAAATVIVITTRGPGPYTANGVPILGLDQTASGTASRQNLELAAMPTSVMLRPSAQPPTPGEAVYMQFVPVQRGTNFGPTESPYATNVFQLPFLLVTPAAGTEAAYEGQPEIGDSLWRQLGVGAPAPVPAGSVSLVQPGLATAFAPPTLGQNEGTAVP